MRKYIASRIFAASASIVMTLPAIALAVEKIEGTVVGTKLTACDFANKRCEGYITLEPKTSGKAESMSIRVKSDTSLTKGSEKVLLPSLRGNIVAVSYEKEKGENLAKSVVVVSSKK